MPVEMAEKNNNKCANENCGGEMVWHKDYLICDKCGACVPYDDYGKGVGGVY